jgi:hypothetical protein
LKHEVKLMKYTSYVRYVAAAVALTWAPSAFAQEDMKACVAAYEGAQTSQKQGKYVAALDQAKACAQSGCGILVNECLKLYEDLSRDVPTFVFSAQDGDGKELVDVNVTVDGQLVFSKLEGTALPLDPGPHVIKFEAAGLPSAEVNHVARVGDRHRLVTAILGEKKKPEAAPAPGVLPPSGPAREEPKGVPVATWVLGGVGVLSLGAFTYLRVSGISDYNTLNSECSPYCDPGEVEDIKSKFTASYVALGIAGGALAGATIIYFAGRGEKKEEAVQASVMPLPGGGAARLMKRF